MRFQIRHAVRNVRICRRMRFAKTEAREFFHHHPGLFALLAGQPIIPAAFRNFPRNRSRSLRPENFAEARRTRSASASDMLPSVCEICITCSGKYIRQRVAKNCLEFWMRECDFFLLRSRFKNNSFDHTPRAWPDQRQCLRYSSSVAPHRAQQSAHGRRFDLETPSFSRLQSRRTFGVVFRYGVKINFARGGTDIPVCRF